ncbi:hypothetical protein T492DRAFT_918807 [Pavlovales sp. CCMP2436]|nr:hypothetical protein T492DRAFT_918807 [Pavlovales sp. CCMP2436]
MSDDTGRVEKYLRAQWKAFPLPFEDFARQFVAQPWSTTGQVHCNLYHSEKLCAIIMGMNTALADAAALDLPAFSVDRVKEGNALTDTSVLLP